LQQKDAKTLNCIWVISLAGTVQALVDVLDLPQSNWQKNQHQCHGGAAVLLTCMSLLDDKTKRQQS